MKKILALSVLGLLALSACDTGNVQVGSGAGAPQTPNLAAGTPQGSSNNQQPGSSTKAADPGKIFFERVTVRNALPELLIAISFESAGTAGASPFGVSLLGNQVFSPNVPYTVGGNSLVYIRNVDVGTDALLSTAIDSLNTTQIYGFPREVMDFSLSSDNSFVAWIDEVGTVTVSNIADGSMTTLDTSSAPSNTIFTHVQWSGDDAHLLVSSPNGTALIFKNGAQETAKPSLLTGVNVSSFSQDGSQLAYFNSATKALHIVDLEASTDKLAGHFESSEIHDLSWNSATSLSYWTKLASQANELRVFVANGSETTVANLTLPTSVGDGVVCPTWMNGQVYFANYDSGKYVIEQQSFATGGSGKDAKNSGTMKTFAATPNADLDEGFVCPKVVK